jgi:hypothetical protein
MAMALGLALAGFLAGPPQRGLIARFAEQAVQTIWPGILTAALLGGSGFVPIRPWNWSRPVGWQCAPCRSHGSMP